MGDRAFFFGAGASIEAGLPVAGQLLDRMLTADIGKLRFAHFSEPAAARLAQNFVRDLVANPNVKWTSGDIEELLNLATVAERLGFAMPFAGRRVEASWAIECLLWLSVLLIDESQQLPEAYTRFAASLREDDTLVTLNYDTLCERYVRTRFPTYDYALGEAAEVRSGRPTESVVRDAGEDAWIVQGSPDARAEPPAKVAQGIQILKLHGSLNWRRCESREDKQCCGRLFVYEEGAPASGYTSATVCECGHGGLRPLIVPPAFVKDLSRSTISHVWIRAIRTLLKAKELFIVGYSMPPYDVMIAQLFRLVSLYNPELRFHIVNPDASAFERFAFLHDSRRDFQRVTFREFASSLEKESGITR